MASKLARKYRLLISLIIGFTVVNPLVPVLPVIQALAQEDLPDRHTIDVCFIAAGKSGQILDHTTLPAGTKFKLPVYSNPDGLRDGVKNPYGNLVGNAVRNSGDHLNADLLHSDGVNDAFCTGIIVDNPAGEEYTYSRSITTSPAEWEIPVYNDQNNTRVSTLEDFFSYSGEYFDEVLGNEYQRNLDADGHIVMAEGRRDRAIIVLNTLLSLPADQPPQVGINLNSGASYTSSDRVNLGLNVIGKDVNQIRIGSTQEGLKNQAWIQYSSDFTEFNLLHADKTGNQTLCVQVRNAAGLKSNVACDTIIWDPAAPVGKVSINNDASISLSNQLDIQLDASDPKLSDGTLGVGGIQMRIWEDTKDGTSWQPFQPSIKFTSKTKAGDATIRIQLRDALKNYSSVITKRITINSLAGSSFIEINNDDYFTNSSQVQLTLNAGNKPVHSMRFKQGSGEWTEWFEYRTQYSWDLGEGYGRKDVYVQYRYTDNSISEPAADAIIFAPYYGVEYSPVATSATPVITPSTGQPFDVAMPEYSLNNIPSEAYTQDEFWLKLDAKNIGTFSWDPDTVHITYFWEVLELDPNFEHLTPEVFRGHNAVLPEVVRWNEQTGELKLLVATPGFPGRYQLQIDTVHEGEARFSEFANPMPTYNMSINQHPNKPLAFYEEELPLPEDAGFYPSHPRKGQRHVIKGNVVLAEQPNDRGAKYKIVETDGSGAVWYIIQHDIGQYLGQEISVPIEFLQDGSYQFTLIGWEATKLSHPTEIQVRPGDRVQVEIRYLNSGYKFWPTNTARLGVVSTHISDFYDPESWYSNGRISIDNRNEVRFGDVARFRFHLKIPNNIANGIQTECYRPLIEDVVWLGDSAADSCIRIVINSALPNPVGLPPLPPEPSGDTGYTLGYHGLAVQSGPHPGFSTSATVPYGTAVTVIGQASFGTHSHWIQVRLVDGTQGWVPANSIDYANTPPTVQFNLNLTYQDMYVCTTGLGARRGPGNNFGVVGTLHYGFHTRVLATSNGWQLITLPSGLTGWINSNSGLCATLPGVTGINGGFGGSVAGLAFYRGQIYTRPINEGAYRISQGFHGQHGGVDYAAPCGTTLKAVADGVVDLAISGYTQGYYENPPAAPRNIFEQATYNARLQAWYALRQLWRNRANIVRIRHDNGSSSLYVHLSTVSVSNGQRVSRGQTIGKVGTTGWSTGCHLHLEIRADANNPNSKINPETVFSQSEGSVALAAEQAFSQRELNAIEFRRASNAWGLLHEHCGAWIKDYDYLRDPEQNWRTYTNLIFNPRTGKAYRTRGDIRLAYWDKYDGPCGALGNPTSDDLWAATSPTGMVGGYQKFDKGTIHSSDLGTFATTGRLNEIHTEGGGTATYGFPKEEMYTEIGRGICQIFEYDETPLCEDSDIHSELFIKAKREILRILNRNYHPATDYWRHLWMKEDREIVANLLTKNYGRESRVSSGELELLMNWLEEQRRNRIVELKNDDERRWLFNALYVRNLRTQVFSNQITDLEAFAQAAEFIAEYWENTNEGRNGFETDLAVVFSNRDGKNCIFSGVGCFGDGTDAQAAFYVAEFGGTGFNRIFDDTIHDTTANVPFHTVGLGVNFAYAGDGHCGPATDDLLRPPYYLCMTVEEWAIYHETWQQGHRTISETGTGGSSWEDLFSSLVAISLGRDLRERRVSIENFGNELRYRFGQKTYNICNDLIPLIPSGNYWNDVTCELVPDYLIDTPQL